MVYKIIGILSLISIIAIKSSISQLVDGKTKLYTFHNYNGKDKEVQFNKAEADKFFGNKVTGLQMTVLDLDFPETTNETSTIYRAVQCLMNGHVEYLQRKVYKNISVRLTSKEPYDTSESTKCSNELLLTLSPPAKVTNTDYIMTNHFKLYERKVILNKSDTKVVEFEDVLNQGFVDMELFWINFEIKGRCSKYVEVELLKPNNSNEWGDSDPPQESNQTESPSGGGSVSGPPPSRP